MGHGFDNVRLGLKISRSRAKVGHDMGWIVGRTKLDRGTEDLMDA